MVISLYFSNFFLTFCTFRNSCYTVTTHQLIKKTPIHSFVYSGTPLLSKFRIGLEIRSSHVSHCLTCTDLKKQKKKKSNCLIYWCSVSVSQYTFYCGLFVAVLKKQCSTSTSLLHCRRRMKNKYTHSFHSLNELISTERTQHEEHWNKITKHHNI